MGVKLGVNIDHVATLRQQRGTRYPAPVAAAVLVGLGGGDSITIHLREDRRHINDWDLQVLRATLEIPLNLEMAASDEMVRIACSVKPDQVTLVPEKREERTTEGGLDVCGQISHLRDQIAALKAAGIPVSLFIEPDPKVLDATVEVGAGIVELHTGRYADAPSDVEESRQLDILIEASAYAHSLRLVVNAGHGLHYQNTKAVAAIANMNELNIGHSIVSHAVMVGMERAVREMKAILLSVGD